MKSMPVIGRGFDLGVLLLALAIEGGLRLGRAAFGAPQRVLAVWEYPDQADVDACNALWTPEDDLGEVVELRPSEDEEE